MKLFNKASFLVVALSATAAFAAELKLDLSKTVSQHAFDSAKTHLLQKDPVLRLTGLDADPVKGAAFLGKLADFLVQTGPAAKISVEAEAGMYGNFEKAIKLGKYASDIQLSRVGSLAPAASPCLNLLSTGATGTLSKAFAQQVKSSAQFLKHLQFKGLPIAGNHGDVADLWSYLESSQAALSSFPVLTVLDSAGTGKTVVTELKSYLGGYPMEVVLGLPGFASLANTPDPFSVFSTVQPGVLELSWSTGPGARVRGHSNLDVVRWVLSKHDGSRPLLLILSDLDGVPTDELEEILTLLADHLQWLGPHRDSLKLITVSGNWMKPGDRFNQWNSSSPAPALPFDAVEVTF